MRKFFKWVGYSIAVVLILGILYLGNLFFMKPLSLDHYLGKEVILEFLDSPEALTYMGIVDRFNWITHHQSKISITGLEDLEEDLIEAKKAKSMLLAFNDTSLTKQQKITKKIAVFDLNNTIEEAEKFPYHSYPLNQIGGIHLNRVEFMTDIHPIRSVKEAKAYIDRLNLFDDSFKATLEVLDAQREAGIYPPKFVFDHVIRQLTEFLNYEKEENPLREVFVRKIKQLELDTETSKDLVSKLDLAIEDSVKPGFSLLLGFMYATLPHANLHHGVWSLPNGDDFYALRLKVYTTTNYSAEEIHNIGLSEVQRITKRMQEILGQLGYGNNLNVGKLMNELNADPKFLYADTPDRKQVVVKDYADIVEETWSAAKSSFHKMPESKVEVRAVPEYSDQIQVPPFIEVGDKIILDTRNCEYVKKV